MSSTVSVKARVSDKRSSILEATLDLISERGFHNTPMSLIAKASGVSAGIIYHYFSGKEELIYELYREIKTDLLQATLEGYSEDLPIRERFLQIWFNVTRYSMQHPEETAFLEQFENSPYSKPSLQEAFSEDMARLVEFANEGIQEGVFKDLPLSVSMELTFGVAVSLAKQHIAGEVVLDDELLHATANACWDAIRK